MKNVEPRLVLKNNRGERKDNERMQPATSTDWPGHTLQHNVKK